MARCAAAVVTPTRASQAQRKALATMGHKGGKKSAQRWNNRESEYAQQQLCSLSQANKDRSD